MKEQDTTGDGRVDVVEQDTSGDGKSPISRLAFTDSQRRWGCAGSAVRQAHFEILAREDRKRLGTTK